MPVDHVLGNGHDMKTLKMHLKIVLYTPLIETLPNVQMAIQTPMPL